jgi:hypothetical protein
VHSTVDAQSNAQLGTFAVALPCFRYRSLEGDFQHRGCLLEEFGWDTIADPQMSRGQRA